MFVSDESAANALANARRDLLPTVPRDFEIGYQTAFADTRYRLLADSETRAYREAYDGYIDDLYKATGKRLDNPYALKIRRNRDFAWDVEPDPREYLPARLSAFQTELSKLAADHPELTLKTHDDLRQQIAGTAQGLKAAADRPTIGWGGLGDFAGSAVATLTDPLNALSMMIGFGGGGAITAARATLSARLAAAGSQIGATALREGALNAGATALAQPSVVAFNQSLGIEHGWAQAAEEVAGAAIGGAVLGGGLKAGGLGLGALLERWHGAKAAGRVAADLDSADAEAVLSAAKARQDITPYPADARGAMASDAALAESLRALLRGEPVDPAILGQFQAHRTQSIAELAARAEGATATTGTSDKVIYGVIHPDQAELIRPRVEALLGRDAAFLGHAARRLDDEALRHALNRHGADPIPFRAADAAHIPDVVETGQLVDISRDHSKGSPFLLWRKLVNGNWLHVGEEVVGEKTATLRMKTAYWTEGPKDRGGNARGGEPGSPPLDARFTGSIPEGRRAYVQNAGDGPVADSVAPPAKKSKTAAALPLPPELRPPAEGRPETLVDFLRRSGGLSDADGWLGQLGVANRVRPGLINNAGLHPDGAALRAWEAGFFPDFHDRPTPDALIHAVADELDDARFARIRAGDEDLAARWRDWEATHAELDRAGVNPAGMTWEQVQDEMRAAKAAERAGQEGIDRAVSDFLAEHRPELEYERALVAEMRGRLMDGDVDIPTGLSDGERAVMVSAQDAMDGFDNEFAAWDAAFGCVTR